MRWPMHCSLPSPNKSPASAPNVGCSRWNGRFGMAPEWGIAEARLMRWRVLASTRLRFMTASRCSSASFLAAR